MLSQRKFQTQNNSHKVMRVGSSVFRPLMKNRRKAAVKPVDFGFGGGSDSLRIPDACCVSGGGSGGRGEIVVSGSTSNHLPARVRHGNDSCLLPGGFQLRD